MFADIWTDEVSWLLASRRIAPYTLVESNITLARIQMSCRGTRGFFGAKNATTMAINARMLRMMPLTKLGPSCTTLKFVSIGVA
jgi:hypothetical protein